MTVEESLEIAGEIVQQVSDEGWLEEGGDILVDGTDLERIAARVILDWLGEE